MHGLIFRAKNSPLSTVEFFKAPNRQVSWLEFQHLLLPSFSVAFLERLFSYSGGTARDFHPTSLFTSLKRSCVSADTCFEMYLIFIQ